MSNFGGTHRPGSRAGENEFRAGLCGDLLTERIIRVQDHRSIGSNGLGKRALFPGDGLARPHELDMRDANISNNTDIGTGDLGQRGDLARMIHSDFPNSDLIG